MRRASCLVLLAVLGLMPAHADAGARRASRQPAATVAPLVAPNGVVTPTWATRRMLDSPVPLYGYEWGRRPWAFPLAQQATASANMARWDQLGYGAGPIPGYTNGPALGNYPTAPRGPTPPRSVQGPGYGPGFAPGSGYPGYLYFPQGRWFGY